MVITRRGKLVFITESFPLELAHKLTALILDAQGIGEMKMAGAAQPALDPEIGEPLTASLIRFFSNCGVMKTAVEAGAKAAASEK